MLRVGIHTTTAQNNANIQYYPAENAWLILPASVFGFQLNCPPTTSITPASYVTIIAIQIFTSTQTVLLIEHVKIQCATINKQTNMKKRINNALPSCPISNQPLGAA